MKANTEYIQECSVTAANKTEKYEIPQDDERFYIFL
jgi:hypothetical protein